VSASPNDPTRERPRRRRTSRTAIAIVVAALLLLASSEMPAAAATVAYVARCYTPYIGPAITMHGSMAAVGDPDPVVSGDELTVGVTITVEDWWVAAVWHHAEYRVPIPAGVTVTNVTFDSGTSSFVVTAGVLRIIEDGPLAIGNMNGTTTFPTFYIHATVTAPAGSMISWTVPTGFDTSHVPPDQYDPESWQCFTTDPSTVMLTSTVVATAPPTSTSTTTSTTSSNPTTTAVAANATTTVPARVAAVSVTPTFTG
jgi:hypothetical protein